MNSNDRKKYLDHKYIESSYSSITTRFSGDGMWNNNKVYIPYRMTEDLELENLNRIGLIYLDRIIDEQNNLVPYGYFSMGFIVMCLFGYCPFVFAHVVEAYQVKNLVINILYLVEFPMNALWLDVL